jgi:hypothetical protein
MLMAGMLGTIVTFICLTYFAFGLFTGGGIFVVWLLAWATGMVVANFAHPNVPWKRELATAIVLALIVATLNFLFFRGWLRWD